jgi:asparagine synthase (glutamine-hydrolysing)
MREAGHTPRTFSIGFDEQQFDESHHAALIARLYKTDHTHIQLTASELLAQLPSALRAMDQPTGDAVNTYVVSGAVRERGIKVALSGLGGDEIFGGYPSFERLTRIADLSKIWGRTPAAFRSATASAVRAVGRSIQATKTAAVLESDGSVSAMFPLMRQLLSPEQRVALLEPSLLDGIADRGDPYTRLLDDGYKRAPAAGLFAQISFAEARTYMHDVLLRDTDQMSMAHALEVRVPLLDHALVDLVTSLPDAVKQSDGSLPKPLLVESLGGLLPESIVRRPKQGFTLPFDPWMRGPLRELCETRLGDHGLGGRGLVKPAALQQLWQSFMERSRAVSWSRLWALVVLDAWCDSNAVSYNGV